MVGFHGKQIKLDMVKLPGGKIETYEKPDFPGFQRYGHKKTPFGGVLV